MIFSLLIAALTCAAVLCLTGPSKARPLGALFGLADTVLWLFAGIAAEKPAVVAVALFCAICFLRPFVRSISYARIRRQHAN